ncbi:LysE family translocator [Corynebacterium choanae]|uniref:Threonine efflux protein n=1 Tax=Corynebacterium choanae TaxID=1862358 RepID=A0A3G6J963_9CORY|nr:LysE family translocator [Corynebacterium choanae]AZA14665.1 Threonine efflux protein [Corynebacterium choanae]
MTSLLLSTAVIWVVAITAPGPDVFQILRQAARSFAAGVWCALGICFGNVVWIALSISGLAALITASSLLFTVLQIAGAAYLAYIGVAAVRGGIAARQGAKQPPRPVSSGGQAPSTAGRVGGQLRWWEALRIGLLTNLSNPKAILFFVSVFSSLLPHGTSLQTTALVVATMLIIQVCWFVGVACAAGAMRRFLNRFGWVIDILAGVVFCGVAAAILGHLLMN